jgi:hypothetical protein
MVLNVYTIYVYEASVIPGPVQKIMPYFWSQPIRWALSEGREKRAGTWNAFAATQRTKNLFPFHGITTSLWPRLFIHFFYRIQIPTDIISV